MWTTLLLNWRILQVRADGARVYLAALLSAMPLSSSHNWECKTHPHSHPPPNRPQILFAVVVLLFTHRFFRLLLAVRSRSNHNCADAWQNVCASSATSSLADLFVERSRDVRSRLVRETTERCECFCINISFKTCSAPNVKDWLSARSALMFHTRCCIVYVYVHILIRLINVVISWTHSAKVIHTALVPSGGEGVFLWRHAMTWITLMLAGAWWEVLLLSVSTAEHQSTSYHFRASLSAPPLNPLVTRPSFPEKNFL